MSDNDELIITRRDGALLEVVINRPDKANALSTPMLEQLIAIFESAGRDAELRALVITGSGERAFCAGADLKELAQQAKGPEAEESDIWATMSNRLRALPVLTVAAINGPCIGGGLTLALACDIRLAVPTARFQYPVLKNNIRPLREDVSSLRQLIGPGRASTILLAGETVLAPEALAWGLVDRLVEKTELLSTAVGMADTALQADPDNLAAIKQLIREESS